jgi:hypothetical protein
VNLNVSGLSDDVLVEAVLAAFNDEFETDIAMPLELTKESYAKVRGQMLETVCSAAWLQGFEGIAGVR